MMVNVLFLFGLCYWHVAVARSKQIGTVLVSENALDDGFDWRYDNGVNTVTAVQNFKGLKYFEEDSEVIFVTLASVADRFAIMHPELPKIQLSNQVVLNCIGNNKKLEIDDVLRYLMDSNGVPDRTCMGWRGKRECCESHICVNCFLFTCTPRDSYFKYPITTYERLDVTNFDSIRDEIRTNGPIACKFDNGFFGTLTGFSQGKFHVKREMGTFYGENGFETRDDLKECWSATVGKIYRAKRRGYEDDNMKPPYLGHHGRHKQFITAKSLPKNFSWAINHEGRFQLTPVQSHHIGPGYCGACYAYASSSTFSDNLKLNKGGANASDVYISPQTIVDCVRGERSHGCFGGNAMEVYEHFMDYGVVDETCNMWVGKTQKCYRHGNSCHGCEGGNFSSYKVSRFGNISGEDPMMRYIYDIGPIECQFASTEAGFSEDYVGDDILCDSVSDPSHWHINHDIEVIGWGETIDGQKYWLVRNSWGTAWGNNGFAKVCRGKDNMLIESGGCVFVQ